MREKIEEILNKLVQDPELKKYPHSYNPIIIDQATDAILEVVEEKSYCKCKEKPIRLISHCRTCGKEIKNPPTIEEMLKEEDKNSIELKFSFDEYSKIRGILIPIKLFTIAIAEMQDKLRRE